MLVLVLIAQMETTVLPEQLLAILRSLKQLFTLEGEPAEQQLYLIITLPAQPEGLQTVETEAERLEEMRETDKPRKGSAVAAAVEALHRIMMATYPLVAAETATKA